MSTTQKSSVEWAINELNTIHALYHFGEIGVETFNQVYKEIIEQAKAMHKEEHRKTFNQGLMSNFQNFEDYYNETYGGNNEQQ